MKKFGTFQVVLVALFAALICVATMLVQIPIPATGGYVNLGDGVILIAAFLMQPVYAVAAAGLGSMLADLLAGYVSFAPGTLVIKAGVALVGALVFKTLGKEKKGAAALPAMIIAGVCAEALMVLGYFFYEAVVLGVGAGAAGGILGNVGQGIAGIAVAGMAAPVLMKNEELKNILRRK